MTVGQPTTPSPDFKQAALAGLQLLQTTIDNLLSGAQAEVTTVAPEVLNGAVMAAEELVPATIRPTVTMILTSAEAVGEHVVEGAATTALTFAKARVDATLQALEKQFQ